MTTSVVMHFTGNNRYFLFKISQIGIRRHISGDVRHKTKCDASFHKALVIILINISNVMQSNQQDICTYVINNILESQIRSLSSIYCL